MQGDSIGFLKVANLTTLVRIAVIPVYCGASPNCTFWREKAFLHVWHKPFSHLLSQAETDERTQGSD